MIRIFPEADRLRFDSVKNLPDFILRVMLTCSFLTDYNSIPNFQYSETGTDPIQICRSTDGGCAFPVAGAKVWIGLPSDVTSASSLAVFKNRLKMYLLLRNCLTPNDTFFSQ